jgi:Ni,Fe-hydrogenase III large subunit
MFARIFMICEVRTKEFVRSEMWLGENCFWKVCDSNHLIRRINITTASVSTLAGTSGSFGSMEWVPDLDLIVLQFSTLAPLKAQSDRDLLELFLISRDKISKEYCFINLVWV